MHGAAREPHGAAHELVLRPSSFRPRGCGSHVDRRAGPVTRAHCAALRIMPSALLYLYVLLSSYWCHHQRHVAASATRERCDMFMMKDHADRSSAAHHATSGRGMTHARTW